MYVSIICMYVIYIYICMCVCMYVCMYVCNVDVCVYVRMCGVYVCNECM